MLGTILIIVLILILLGSIPAWPYSRGWGYYPSGGLGLVLHRGSTSAARGIGGFALAVLAAPGLLVAGVPLRGGAGLYAVAAAGSALLWMLLGAIAARRATRSPVATWRDFWREWLWLALAVWVGVGLSLVAANFLLGRPAL